MIGGGRMPNHDCQLFASFADFAAEIIGSEMSTKPMTV